MKHIFRKVSDEKTADQKQAISVEVLDVIFSELCKHEIRSVYLAGVDRNQINDVYKVVEKFREWLGTQTDKDVVKSYNFWLDDFEKKAKRAEKDLDRQDRLANAARTVSVPKPNF